MAAHLARHTNTIHGSGGRKAGRAGRMKPRVGRPPRAAAAAGAGGEGAIRVLKEMETYRDTLFMQRSSIDCQIAGIENAMNAMGAMPIARPVGKRRGRPAAKGGRAGSLKDMIVKVLRQRSKPLTPQEIAKGVVSAGYTTSSKNLTKAVSNALPMLKMVKKVDRGLYQA
jgi:hypothetical protein